MRQTIDKIKDWVHNISEYWEQHHKAKMFLYAAIVVACCFGIWLATTNQGWIARDSVGKTFDVNRERVITVYSANGDVIREFKGTYNIEFFSDEYLVVMNQHTKERVNIYGSSSVIIDESPDFNHMPHAE